MPDQIVTVPLAEALPQLGSPYKVHRLAMSFLPDLKGGSRAIRADLGVLYRLSLPTELDGVSGAVRIRFRSSIRIGGAQEAPGQEGFAPGQRFTVRVVAEKRRENEEGKTMTRFVGDEEAQQWATALLERHGLRVSGLVVSPRWDFGERRRSAVATAKRSQPDRGSSGKSIAFTLRDLTATVEEVTGDGSAFSAGLGRGKAYGYGMPIIL